MKRELRVKIFLGSTTEETSESLNEFLEQEHFCPNYVSSDLYKHGSVYQLILWYAVVI